MSYRFLLILTLFLFSPLHSRAEDALQHTTAQFHPTVTAIGNAESIDIALTLKMEDGWKTYWRTPGEAGLAPVFDWQGSTNLKSAEILWPAPHRFTTFDIENYGYKDTVIFPIRITLEKPGEALDIHLNLDVLICKDICVPEKHQLSHKIRAGSGLMSTAFMAFEEGQKTVPSAENIFYSLRLEGKTLVAEAALPTAPSPNADVFVEHPSFPSFGMPALATLPEGKYRFSMTLRSDTTMGDLQKGDFVLTYVDGDKSFENKLSLTAPLVPVAEKPPVENPVTLGILLLALAGGLILNLMPCVLPILSLKILSVVSHGGHDSRAVIFRNFMASSAGIIFSFWLMAGALLLLKSAGETIGWGIQFQNPFFLSFLILVVLAFAANMWGVFEIPLPRFIARNIPQKHEHEPTLAGHFLTGIFATLLATPCTAPFLGTAVGFALAGSASHIFLIFTFLGLGLALPYILLAISPGIFKYMPKPGHWMVTMKKVLAIALLATALWLGAVWVSILNGSSIDTGWQPFDEALIAPAIADGKIVIVDVTADWCLTCKANKKFVLESAAVKEALSQPNILKLQANWTRKDETIAVYLRKNGRYGIPFNAIYGSKAPNGILLPELLTANAIMDALKAANEGGPQHN